jgi:hypothetical protein
MTTLSPAAQAVLYAITEISPAPADEIAAAALRAAADQVVPEAPCPGSIMGPVYVAEAKKQRDVRQCLLAIAAELDGTNSPSEND